MKYFFVSIIMLCGFFANAEQLTLALNWKAEPEFGGFYEAQLKGFYKNKTLEVKITEGGSGTPTIQMLANDKVDFAIVSADELILSHDRKNKNKVIALFAVYQKSPYIIMTHDERNFRTLKDVWTSEGILSLQNGLPYYQFLVQKLGKPKVKIVPYLGGVGNFLADKKFSQQGFISTEPVTAEKGGAKVKNFLIADEGFNPYLVVIATTEKTLKEKPEQVKKFIAASREGWEAYLLAPQDTNKHMATLNKALDLDTFNKGALAQKDLIKTPAMPIGTMTADRWAVLIQQLKSLKLIKSTPSVDDLYLNPK